MNLERQKQVQKLKREHFSSILPGSKVGRTKVRWPNQITKDKKAKPDLVSSRETQKVLKHQVIRPEQCF